MKLVSLFVIALLFGCAKNNESVVRPEQLRLSPTDVSGQFLFLKTLYRVDRAGREFRSLATGKYLESDRIVEFKWDRHVLSVVQPGGHRELAQFPLSSHSQSESGISTGEDKYQDWDQSDIVSSHPKTGIVWSADRNEFHFEVAQLLSDDTQLVLKYSFLRYQPNPTYIPRAYPKSAQNKFGFFKVSAGKETSDEFLSRRDPTRPIVYHFSNNFPAHLKPIARAVFARWNEAFVSAVGKPLLVLEENSGQMPGELNSNLIQFVDGQHSGHNVLGTGMSYTDPNTGEIVKADVVINGDVLKRALEKQRAWSTLNGTPIKRASVEAPSLFENPDAFEALADKFDKRAHSDLDANVTRLDGDTEQKLAHLTKQTASTDEVLATVFGPLIAHELGHNLGLRHNFMGSVDHVHFAKGSKSSSVMDYAFLYALEPAGPGPYDTAALQYGYGVGGQSVAKLMSQNFLFCSDDEVESNQNGYCQQRDIGTTLSEIVEHFRFRYVMSWTFNNVQTDDVFEEETEEKYQESVYRLLKPIRVIYDYSNAIFQNIESKDWKAAWELLGTRIEATPKTVASDLIPIKVVVRYELQTGEGKYSLKSASQERKLDAKLIRDARADALRAREAAIDTLLWIAQDETRPSHDKGGSIRGVLHDRLLALQFMTSSSALPVGDGTNSPVMSSSAKVVPTLASLVSNSPRSYPVKLRSLAIQLQEKQAKATPPVSEMVSMLEVQKIPARWEKIGPASDARELYEKLEAFRLEILYSHSEEYLKTVLEKIRKSGLVKTIDGKPAEIVDAAILAEWWFGDSTTFDKLMQPAKVILEIAEEKLNTSEKEIVQHEVRRRELRRYFADRHRAAAGTKPFNRANIELERVYTELASQKYAYAQLDGDSALRAPLSGSRAKETATGRLIKDNINRSEDEAIAVRIVLAESLSALEKALSVPHPIVAQIDAINDKVSALRLRLNQLERTIYAERLLLRNLQRTYLEAHG